MPKFPKPDTATAKPGPKAIPIERARRVARAMYLAEHPEMESVPGKHPLGEHERMAVQFIAAWNACAALADMPEGTAEPETVEAREKIAAIGLRDTVGPNFVHPFNKPPPGAFTTPIEPPPQQDFASEHQQASERQSAL